MRRRGAGPQHHPTGGPRRLQAHLGRFLGPGAAAPRRSGGRLGAPVPRRKRPAEIAELGLEVGDRQLALHPGAATGRLRASPSSRRRSARGGAGGRPGGRPANGECPRRWRAVGRPAQIAASKSSSCCLRRTQRFEALLAPAAVASATVPTRCPMGVRMAGQSPPTGEEGPGSGLPLRYDLSADDKTECRSPKRSGSGRRLHVLDRPRLAVLGRGERWSLLCRRPCGGHATTAAQGRPLRPGHRRDGMGTRWPATRRWPPSTAPATTGSS